MTVHIRRLASQSRQGISYTLRPAARILIPRRAVSTDQRRDHSEQPSLDPLANKPRKSKKVFADLPKTALDTGGQPLPPLEPLVAPVKRGRRKKSPTPLPAEEEVATASTTKDDHAQHPRLDEKGPQGQAWPALAKDVLTNLARFPGCILLTRVGGFYEVSAGLLRSI